MAEPLGVNGRVKTQDLSISLSRNAFRRDIAVLMMLAMAWSPVDSAAPENQRAL